MVPTQSAEGCLLTSDHHLAPATMATIDSLPNETLSDIMEMLKEPVLTYWYSDTPKRRSEEHTSELQ